MPERSAGRPEFPLSRRKALAGSVGIAATLSGCISTSSTSPGQQTNERAESGSENVKLLKAGGSSTVYTVASKAASLWSANHSASDEEYWRPGQYGIQTDENLADYWAGMYGFEPRDGGPPFEVSISLSNSGTGLEKLRQGQLDIGNATAPVEVELRDLDDEELEKFTDHVVGVDAPRIVVSRAIYDTGVDLLTADQFRGIYRNEITDWTQIDRYDGAKREIQAVGRTPGSATETLIRANLLGNPDAEMPGVDVRKSENQQVKTIVANSNNAIGYMSMGFVSEETPAVALEVGDKTFRPGENLSDPDYPLARNLHCYTYEGTSKMEAAFLRMIMSSFGQEVFVEPAGYSPLTDERRKEEIGRLPEPEA